MEFKRELEKSSMNLSCVKSLGYIKRKEKGKMGKGNWKRRFGALILAIGMVATTCLPAMAEGLPEAAGAPKAALPEAQEIAAIDFGTVDSLDSLNGWKVSPGVGTAALEEDAEQGKVLKMSRTTSGDETSLTFDALGIDENAYRYVSVETVMKLGTEDHANQFSIPYLSDSSNTVAYTLLAEGDWSEYKSHVNGSSTKLSAGAVKPGSWQKVVLDIDLKEDTFRVSVDGEYLLVGAGARAKVDNLQKIKYYADSWNTGAMYLKSVKVSAQAERTQGATFYVGSNGDDAADGQSEGTAWATIERVNREHFIPGDKILFQKGGVWADQTLQPQGSGSEEVKITLGSYGEGDMPKIAANAKVKDAIFLCNQQYWEITGLDVSNTAEGFPMATNGTLPAGNVSERNDEAGAMLGDFRGIHIAGRDIPSLKGFWIHGVKVHDVTGHVAWIGDTGLKDKGIVNNGKLDGSKRTGGLLFECLSPTKGTATQFSEIVIEKSEFINNSFSGIAVKQWHGEGDQYKGGAWDARNGAGGAPDYYDPDWKPHSNIVIQDNYINQGASAYACNGIYLTSSKDSLIQRNVLEHIGTCGIELYFADNVAVQYNEVSDVVKKAGGADDNAIDPDWRVTNALIQYNYVHGCGEGFLLCGVAFNSGVLRYNLVQDCTRSYVHYSMGSGYFQLYNNVFYRSKDGNATNNFDPWGNGSAAYFNNVFYDGKGTGFAYSGGTSFAFHNNAYFGTAAPSKESNPIILSESPFEGDAPSMDRGGSFATGVLLEANGLRPKQSSLLIASGVNADSNGVSIEDGLAEKGTKFNFTPLAAMNASWDNCVNMARVDYPTFTNATGEQATFDKDKAQTPASPDAPTIGMFEVAMDANAVLLRGTVSDGFNALADAEVKVTVGGKTVTVRTNEAGSYSITEGLVAGEATIEAGGKTVKVTLQAGKVNVADITTDLVDMPKAYEKTILNEAFDKAPEDAFVFDSGSAVEDGQLVITKGMGNAKAAVASFPAKVSGQKAVDFSFDWKCDPANKRGFQFRDSYDRLLFAVCAADNAKQLRTSTNGGAVDSAKAADKEEPKWDPVALDTSKTYTFRIHADFTAKKVSFRLSEKDGEVLAQKINVSTDAVNLAKMNACSWWDSKPQYIDNFVLTAPEELELPLAGKTAYAFGDSIVAGHQYEKASFVNYAASQEGMQVQKFAVNGATILNAGYSGGQILAQLEKASGTAPDYVLFDGGTNDAEYLVNNPNISLGVVSDAQDAAGLDANTFAGAFEQTIVKMKEKWPNAQIIYVAVHKMGSRDVKMQEELHEIEIQACKKHSVAVADVYGEGKLDTVDVNQKNTYTFDSNGDNGLPGINGTGTHPNLSAIEAFYMPVVTEALRNPKVPGTEKPEKKLVSIRIAKAPQKTEYRQGEPLDLAGLELEASYDDNTTEKITAGYEASGYNAVQAGEQSITVTYQGKTAVFSVTVKAEEPVKADKAALKAAIAEAGKLNAKAYTADSWEKFQKALGQAKAIDAKADATQQEVTDAVSALGKAKGALQPKQEEPAPVKVRKITIANGKSAKIVAGKKISLKAKVTPSNAANKKVTWSIAKKYKNYASVSSKGVVTAKKKGAGKTVTVTAVAKDGSKKKASIKISIMKNAVTKISLKAANVKKNTVKAGKKVKVKATVRTNGQKANKALVWKSSNTKWATVSSKGIVTTKKAGKGKTVTITAAATDGTNKKATVKIKIK